MKKQLFLLVAFSVLATVKALAAEWTDANGVTWTFDIYPFGSTNATISGASNYGEDVTVPSTVYNGSTQYTVTGISTSFPSGTNVILPSTITSIASVFTSYVSGTIKLNATTPPTLSSLGGNSVTVFVPASALSTYQAADKWKDIAVNIISQDANTSYAIKATAQASSSGIHQAIGEENLVNVMSLTVVGSINSYDIMIMRNKMHNLHHLNLTNADIVANSYPYYQNYTTTDNVLGEYTFYGMNKLISVKLPNTITSIGNQAFQSCRGLKSVNISNSVKTIGYNAFESCCLTSVTIPYSVTTILGGAFRYCKDLVSVTISNNVTEIPDEAFMDCSSLVSVSIPNSVTSISDEAFQSCI